MTCLYLAEGLSHFQKAIEFLEESYPKIALALKLSKSLDLDLRYVLLLDNQCPTCVGTGASCPGSRRQVVL
jgi:hypothetical protein